MTVVLLAKNSAIDQHEPYKLDTKTMKLSALKVKYKSTFNSWRNVKQRCREMGIALDQRLVSFPDFLYHLGPRPKNQTVDRKHSEGPYLLENLWWATTQQQASNRRSTVRLTYNGETLPLTEWAKKLGVSAYTLRDRRRKGWSDAEIVTGRRGSSKQALSGPLPWPKGAEQYWESLFSEQANDKESREEFSVRVCQGVVRDLSMELLSHAEGYYDDHGGFIHPSPPPAKLVAKLERARKAFLEAQRMLAKAVEQTQPKQHRFDDLFPE